MKKIIWGIALLFSTSLVAGAHTCCHNSAQKCGCKRGYYTQYYGDKPELIKEAIAWTESGIWRNGFDKAKPHSSVNLADFYLQYQKNPQQWQALFDYLAKTDLLSIPKGKHKIPGSDLLVSVEDSGGYGKLDKLRIPVIETADYMETSPLGRAEWIKLYGLLLGSSKADSLFSAIEKEYLQLKAEAAKLPLGLSILTERKTGNVWYVPGGKSTMGILLRDAHARYIFADDTHSGSLSMSPEQIIAKGNQVDVWAFKYFGGNALTKQDLLAEYQGYQALKAFQTGTVYETDTSCEPYFELTSFHPEILLREFIILSHPEAGDKFGKLRFYKKY